MATSPRKSTLTQFGLQCRETRQRFGKTVADQAVSLGLKPSDIAKIEMGEAPITSEYIESFGRWLNLGELSTSKFRVFARTDNVVPFRRNKSHQEARKLFRKVNQLSPSEIRKLGERLKEPK